MYATTRRFRPAWAGLTAAAMCALLSACSSGSSDETIAAQQANGTGTGGTTATGTTPTAGTGTTTPTAGTTGTTTGTTPAAPRGSGIVRLSLTDAPSCGFSAVNLTIAGVRMNTSGNAAPSEAGWVDIPIDPPLRVNLLDLQNGQLLRLGETVAPEGTYDQVRLILAGNPAGTATTAAGTATTPGATGTAGTTGTTAGASSTTPATPAVPATPGTATTGTAGAAGTTGTTTAGAAGTTGTPTPGTAGPTAAAGTATTLANSVVPVGGAETALDAPATLANGIPVIGSGLRVTNATPAEIALDVDACRSVAPSSNGTFSMRPVIRAIPLAESGTILGNIDPAVAAAGNVTVNAQTGEGEVLRSAAVAPDGSFALSATPAGKGVLNVVIQAPARGATVITDVPVTALASGGAAGTFVTSSGGGGTTPAAGTSPTTATAGTTGTTTAGTPTGATATAPVVTRLSDATTPIPLAASPARTASGIVGPLAASAGAAVRALGAVGAGRFETAYANADPANGSYVMTLPIGPILTGNYNAQGALNLVPADPTTGGIYQLQAASPGFTPQTVPINLTTVPAVQNFVLVPTAP